MKVLRALHFVPQVISLSCPTQEKAANRLSDDLCLIEREGGTDRFIRAVLEIPIHGVTEPFVWVCNDISLYPYQHSRPADVIVQAGRRRPKVILHRGDPETDPLVIDQTQGISVARAQEPAKRAMHGD